MLRFHRVSLWALAGAMCGIGAVRAVALTGLRTAQTEIQTALRARPDCLAWYSFGTGNDKWAVWVGTEGSDWQVWNARRLGVGE